MKFENNKEKFNIFIGLKKSDMVSLLDEKKVKKEVKERFSEIGIKGFNISKINGIYKGEEENTLKVSFINTFDVKIKKLIKTLERLKTSLEQESILIEREQVNFNFV